MYHDYFDAADGAGLRNPYDPEPQRPDGDWAAARALVLLGLVGAGLVGGVGAPAPTGRSTAQDAGAHDAPLRLILGADDRGGAA